MSVRDTLAEVIDELVVAVDRLFVAELREGIAGEDTIDLVARARDLAIAAGEQRAARGRATASEATWSG